MTEDEERLVRLVEERRSELRQQLHRLTIHRNSTLNAEARQEIEHRRTGVRLAIHDLTKKRLQLLSRFKWRDRLACRGI